MRLRVNMIMSEILKGIFTFLEGNYKNMREITNIREITD